MAKAVRDGLNHEIRHNKGTIARGGGDAMKFDVRFSKNEMLLLRITYLIPHYKLNRNDGTNIFLAKF